MTLWSRQEKRGLLTSPHNLPSLQRLLKLKEPTANKLKWYALNHECNCNFVPVFQRNHMNIDQNDICLYKQQIRKPALAHLAHRISFVTSRSQVRQNLPKLLCNTSRFPTISNNPGDTQEAHPTPQEPGATAHLQLGCRASEHKLLLQKLHISPPSNPNKNLQKMLSFLLHKNQQTGPGIWRQS